MFIVCGIKQIISPKDEEQRALDAEKSLDQAAENRALLADKYKESLETMDNSKQEAHKALKKQKVDEKEAKKESDNFEKQKQDEESRLNDIKSMPTRSKKE